MIYRDIIPPLLLLLLLAISVPSLSQSTLNDQIFTYPERIIKGDTVLAEYERGILFVPLNRSDPNSETISIDFYRFKSLNSDSNTPPVFRLPGGPGFPSVDLILYYDPEFYQKNIKPFQKLADVVIVGQRGTAGQRGTIGTSKPATNCVNIEGLPIDKATDEEALKQQIREACQNCKDYWDEQLDLSGFSVIEAAGDVKDLTKALRYDQIILNGLSFGSHWSMAVMRYHPEIVARALLGGMEGPNHTYDMPSHVLNAIQRIATSAEASPGLQDHLPDSRLVSAYYKLIQQAKRQPITVKVDYQGEERIVLLDHHDLQEYIYGHDESIKSRKSLATWPFELLRLINGNYQQAARYKLEEGSILEIPTASFFMLDCGSGISAQRHEQYKNDTARAILGDAELLYEVGCEVWNADLGEEFRMNFETSIPTLIVHGNWDVSTPLENAQELAPYFTNGKLVTVRRGSHGALYEAITELPEFRQQIEDFITGGTYEDIPNRIELPPIAWEIPTQ